MLSVTGVMADFRQTCDTFMFVQHITEKIDFLKRMNNGAGSP